MRIVRTASYKKVAKEDTKDLCCQGEEEKDWDPNPWAVCTDSVGRGDKDKYERCVQDVKSKQK